MSDLPEVIDKVKSDRKIDELEAIIAKLEFKLKNLQTDYEVSKKSSVRLAKALEAMCRRCAELKGTSCDARVDGHAPEVCKEKQQLENYKQRSKLL